MRAAKVGPAGPAGPVKAKPRPKTLPGAMAATRGKVDAMAAVTAGFKGWRPAAEVLREVVAVPTRFLQYDVATGVAGHPTGRVCLLHGPSDEGKSRFSTGLGASFLERGHFFGLIDAERTATPKWLRTMMGNMVGAPGFVALPSSEYEKAVEGVREFALKIAEARTAGNLPPDTTGIVVIDSIRKLVPKDIMKRLLTEVGDTGGKTRGRFDKKPKGVDGFGGRAAQMKAALNASWMDELVPLLAETGISALIIARESEGEDDDDVHVSGGRALRYDSSLWLRVTRNYLWEEGAGDKRRVVGEQHVVTIERSKLSGKTDRVVRANFHCSNGLEAPEGFWPERDALEEAVECGVVELRGSYYFHEGKRIGQGKPGVLRRLQEDPPLLGVVQAGVRATTRKEES